MVLPLKAREIKTMPDEKIITCVDSCHFCKRSALCKHFGEEGYHCTTFVDMRPPEDEDGRAGDADLGVSYAAENY